MNEGNWLSKPTRGSPRTGGELVPSPDVAHMHALRRKNIDLRAVPLTTCGRTECKPRKVKNEEID